MKFDRIKRTKCSKCKKFLSCAVNQSTAICNRCDPQLYVQASEAQKEAWLKGDFR